MAPEAISEHLISKNFLGMGGVGEGKGWGGCPKTALYVELPYASLHVWPAKMKLLPMPMEFE